MKLPRRQFLYLAAGAAALPAVSRNARAQTYPTKPVRLIVGYAAGGAADITARLSGNWLSEHLGQPFIVESRPGAGTNIAAEVVVRSSPDGYTLLLASPANAINATLYNKLNFNFVRDIAPVGGITSVSLVMVANPSVPATTVLEFIAYAKANPGKLNMASGGNGVPSHVAGEQFKMMADVDMTHVPYRGETPAIIDVIGGRAEVFFPTILGALEQIRAGKLRAFAVTTARRSDVLPDLPSLSEFLPGYEASTRFGIGAPKNTPAEIVDRLNREINAGLSDAKLKARLTDIGGAAIPGTPADFGNLVTAETEKWGKVVKFAGMKPE
jgi:tripartite-type tricarboxylate transporter receptor subunit TctC